MVQTAPAIGIDLGTTYSRVAVWQNNRVEIIHNGYGHFNVPSYVAFNEKGCLIGNAALMQITDNPRNTVHAFKQLLSMVFDVKRLIGRKFTDSAVEIDKKTWPFALRSGPDNMPKLCVQHQGRCNIFTAEEISAMVLMTMKQLAQSYLRCAVELTRAVVTVPAYFNDSQRQATLDACAIAGLEVLCLMNEPSAAAITYALDGAPPVGKRNMLIFDLGGGTLDVSLLTMEEGVLKVKSTAGDTHLGGQDFDKRLMMHLQQEFKVKYNKDISSDPCALRRLRAASERAKCTLSSATEASIEIELLFECVSFRSSITRARFEGLCRSLFSGCMDCVHKCLNDARLKQKDVHDIVLVGGSTRIPKLRELLHQCFADKEHRWWVLPDEAVARGAAVYAAKLSGALNKQMEVLDVTPHSLRLYSLFEDCKEAGGGDPHKLDTRVIARNTRIPTTQEHRLLMPFHDIRVHEECDSIGGNNLLGRYSLKIPDSPHGPATLYLHMDLNGILGVTAKFAESSEASIISSDKGRLSNDDVNRMAQEAKQRFNANGTFAHLKAAWPESPDAALRQQVSNRPPMSPGDTLALMEASGTASSMSVPPLAPGAVSHVSAPPLEVLLKRLEHQLDAMHEKQAVLLRRIVLLGSRDRRVGGQGVVQFARHKYRKDQKYAVKFFLKRSDFEAERAHLENPRLIDAEVMPAIEDVCGNEDGSCTCLGWPIPPMIIMEKGESLDAWLTRRDADVYSAMHIVMHLVERVVQMHDAMVVHRDLKPANVIFYPANNRWALIDFGGAATIGSRAPLICTMSYAAPETVLARMRGESTVVADVAVDVWALGIIAYEVCTRSRVFPSTKNGEVEATMRGERPLPWEDLTSPEHGRNLRRLMWLQDGILGMLERDPARRAKLSDVSKTWRKFLHVNTTRSIGL